MKFTIDINRTYNPGLENNSYRLRYNGGVRAVGIWEIISGEDLVLDTLEETVAKINNYSSINIKGEDLLVNPNELVMGEVNTIYLSPKVHRETKPHIFSNKELVNVISNGNDNQNNCLVIDLQGHIKLQNSEEARALFSPVAVRYETFCEGNGYVGHSAAKDLTKDGELYLSMLDGFLTHLKNGDLDQYVDFPSRFNKIKIMADIYKILNHLD